MAPVLKLGEGVQGGRGSQSTLVGVHGGRGSRECRMVAVEQVIIEMLFGLMHWRAHSLEQLALECNENLRIQHGAERVRLHCFRGPCTLSA